MTEPDVDVEQVIAEVLSAECEADDVNRRPRPGRREYRDVRGRGLRPARWRSARRTSAAALAVVPGLVTVAELDGVPLLYARAGARRRRASRSRRGFRDLLVATVKSVRFRAPPGFGDCRHHIGRCLCGQAQATARVAPLITTRGRLKRRRTAAGQGSRGRVTRSAAALLGAGGNHPQPLGVRLAWRVRRCPRDHIHQDNVAPPRAFTIGSEAAVKLAQAVCKHIYAKIDLVIDGDFVL